MKLVLLDLLVYQLLYFSETLFQWQYFLEFLRLTFPDNSEIEDQGLKISWLPVHFSRPSSSAISSFLPLAKNLILEELKILRFL